MSEKISQYTADGSSNPIQKEDLLDFSNANGGGFDVSKKITVQEFELYLNNALNTIYNANGVQAGDRTITAPNRTCTWDGGTVVTKSDGINDNGFLLFDSLNVLKGGISYDVSLSSATLDLKNTVGSYFLASDGVVTVASEIEMKEQFGLGTIGKIGHALTDYSILFDSGTDGVILNAETGKTVSIRINNDPKWKFDADKISSNDGVGMKVETYNGGGAIYGFGVQASTFENIIPAGAGIKFVWGQGTSGSLTSLMSLDETGLLNLPSLPTSSAGLSAGDVWNNSGVLNIV